MIKRIKALFALKEENRQLRNENLRLITTLGDKDSQIYYLTNKKPEVKDLLAIVLDGDLKWYDYEELKPEERQNYYTSAQQVLRAHAFNNEINFLKSNWGKRALLEAHDKNIEEVSQHIQKMSWMLLGNEQFKIKLEEISNPTQQEKTKENIDSAV